MEIVKKTALGGYKEADRSEYTHVILTRAEYQILQNNLRQERLSVELAESNTSKVQREMRGALQTAQKEAQDAISALRKELDAQISETERQAALNANLIRIAKERANAARGLTPKKDHPGYVVLFSTERKIGEVKAGRSGELTPVKGKETTIQTPYSVDIEERQLHVLLRNDEQIFARIGIDGTGNLKDKSEKNLVLDCRLKANYRSGLWELILTHTRPLKSVPQDLRG